MSAGRLNRLVRALRSAAKWLLLIPILAYRRLVSPMLPASCRYYPTCAGYAEEAIRLHGPVRGSWLAAKRLARCHPWTPGGVDHVPDSPRASQSPTASLSAPSTVTGA